MKLALIATLSLAVGWLLAYGALKTAQSIAQVQSTRLEIPQ